VVCFNKVIIQAKRGQVSAPYDSLKIGHQSIVNFFFGSGFLETGAASTAGSTTGSTAGAGVDSTTGAGVDS
jgi:hypothetical protein